MTVELALPLVSGLVVGITAHEFAHAWTASLLGDDYPRRRGRVSLNPLRHLAPLGTLAVFLLPFGWGRPVPVNLYNFRRPKRDYLLCSLAGPAANLAVVGLCFALMLLTGRCFALGRRMVPALLEGHSALKVVAMLNVMLAVINLLPIPPLDGSKIWPLIIPSLKPGYGARAGGVFIIVLLLLVWSGAVDRVVLRATDWVFEIMPTSDMEVFRGRYEKAMAAFRSCRFAQAERHFSAALAVNPGPFDGRAGGGNGRRSGVLRSGRCGAPPDRGEDSLRGSFFCARWVLRSSRIAGRCGPLAQSESWRNEDGGGAERIGSGPGPRQGGDGTDHRTDGRRDHRAGR